MSVRNYQVAVEAIIDIKPAGTRSPGVDTSAFESLIAMIREERTPTTAWTHTGEHWLGTGSNEIYGESITRLDAEKQLEYQRLYAEYLESSDQDLSEALSTAMKAIETGQPQVVLVERNIVLGKDWCVCGSVADLTLLCHEFNVPTEAIRTPGQVLQTC